MRVYGRAVVGQLMQVGTVRIGSGVLNCQQGEFA